MLYSTNKTRAMVCNMKKYNCEYSYCICLDNTSKLVMNHMLFITCDAVATA